MVTKSKVKKSSPKKKILVASPDWRDWVAKGIKLVVIVISLGLLILLSRFHTMKVMAYLLEKTTLQYQNQLTWVAKQVIGERVLGVQDEVRETIKAELEEKVEFWKQVVEREPAYVEGWIRLATYSWRLRKDELAREYLNQAVELDPNNEVVEKLRQLMEK